MTINDIITLPVSQAVINKTVTNTIRKYSHTHRTLMYGRTPVELLDNIYMGDMANRFQPQVAQCSQIGMITIAP